MDNNKKNMENLRWSGRKGKIAAEKSNNCRSSKQTTAARGTQKMRH